MTSIQYHHLLIFYTKIFDFKMEQLLQISNKFRNNPDIIDVINPKTIKRNVLWNYLKRNDQVGNFQWQYVKYQDLKSSLLEFWEKRKILNSNLSIEELTLLLSETMKHRFNINEIGILKSKLIQQIQIINANPKDFHVLILYKYIDITKNINDPYIQSKIQILKLFINKERNMLLKKMIVERKISTYQKHYYLHLNKAKINFNDASTVHKHFNDMFQAHRNKYIMKKIKQRSVYLYNNCIFD